MPKLRNVIRLDSMPIKNTYFTEEGYLKDTPILTSTGIFEYVEDDGTIRRELRVPEEVFDEASLKSYKGKPVIITHDAGLVDKDNVHENQIGTILTEGYQDGENVRAEIIIHDTDEMRECGLKELSLGYNLDLDETPGTWNGQHYDAVQRNIRINHLALVREARAGDQARLNIDSRDSKILKGGKKAMSKKAQKNARRNDGKLSPEEFAKAIAEYKARRAAEKKTDGDDGQEVVGTTPEVGPDQSEGEATEAKTPETIEEKVDFVKDRRDRRDEEGNPESTEEANEIIAHQDEDIGMLIDIIDTLLAEKEFNESATDEDDTPEEAVAEDCGDNENCDGEDEEEDPALENEDEDEEESEDPLAEDEDDEEAPEDQIVEDEDDEEENLDSEDDDIPTTDKESVNMDAMDKLVRQRIQLGVVGNLLHMDGLESMKSLTKAKKRVIKAVRPDMRLDGKSSAYIDAAFDLAVSEAKKRNKKDTAYQKRQMFNKDSRSVQKPRKDSADAARQRMIERHHKKSK